MFLLYTCEVCRNSQTPFRSLILYACVIFSRARLKSDGLLMAGPPCSLMGPACSSVHKRHDGNTLGDIRVWKVRLSNRIWVNLAPWTCPDLTGLSHHLKLHVKPGTPFCKVSPIIAWVDRGSAAPCSSQSSLHRQHPPRATFGELGIQDGLYEDFLQKVVHASQLCWCNGFGRRNCLNGWFCNVQLRKVVPALTLRFKIPTWMGAFKHDLPKSTHLWSNCRLGMPGTLNSS